ncbi:MAG: hypothetical protein WD534_06870 [Phycisphaeraceae bacterium]
MPATPPTGWPAYALGAVLGAVGGLLAAELSFMLTGAITGRGWADGAWWQYGVAGLAFLAVAMGVMVVVGRRVRAAVRRKDG